MATKTGTLVSEDELKNIDPSKITKTEPYVESEVEGQGCMSCGPDLVVCPACGASALMELDPVEWTYIDCSCGVTFRA